MAQLTPLEQVKLDAERLTLKRIADEKERLAWQESKDGQVTFEDSPEPVAVEPEVKKPKEKTVTKRKAK